MTSSHIIPYQRLLDAHAEGAAWRGRFDSHLSHSFQRLRSKKSAFHKAGVHHIFVPYRTANQIGRGGTTVHFVTWLAWQE
jgi:hypothetical protein